MLDTASRHPARKADPEKGWFGLPMPWSGHPATGRGSAGRRTEYSPRRFAPPPSRRGAGRARGGGRAGRERETKESRPPIGGREVVGLWEESPTRDGASAEASGRRARAQPSTAPEQASNRTKIRLEILWVDLVRIRENLGFSLGGCAPSTYRPAGTCGPPYLPEPNGGACHLPPLRALRSGMD